MKKITLLFAFMAICWQSFSQTLNQNASWPNAAWTVTGSYNTDPLAFEADPTATSNFAFDDDDAGSGSDDDIAAESPIIDLTAANTAGETWLTVTVDYTYNFLADSLTLEYWDADTASWVAWEAFTENDNSTTNNFCSGTRTTFTSMILNISGFSATQLSGFRYRISFLDDGGAGGAAWEWGFCFDSPTITSATPPTCLDPSMLTVSNITDTTADLGWTENGTATVWDIELGVTGFTPTGTATASGVTNPYTAMSLAQDTTHDFYVRAVCGSGDTSNWVGPFSFTTLETCPAPSALNASNIMETSADLSWTENGVATVWDVEIVTSGTAATGTPTNSGVANPFNATGFTQNTTYDYYVRADCGGMDGQSSWVGPFTFTTACAAIAAPYTEDFETFTTSTTPFALGNCWAAPTGAPSYYWESAPGTDTSSGGTGPNPSITTGNYFFTESSGSNTGDIAELASPLVDLSALTAPALTFNYHMFGDQIGTLDVIVNGTTTEWTLSGQQQISDTDPWELAVVDLATYAGQTISVTFRATGAGTFEGDISIDNVSFTELPSCIAPNALTATNITDTTADLSWTENGTATVWDIELGLDGFTPTGTATASGVGNPYTVMSLTENTAYEYYVRSDCGGGTFSTWAGPFSFVTECSVIVPSPNYTTDFSTFLPNCWEEADNGDATTGPTNLGAGSWAQSASLARINLFTTGKSDWLVSPTFDLSAGGLELVLSVSGQDFGASAGTFSGMGSDDEVEVLISTDNGATWSVIYTYDATGNTLPANQANTIIDLSTYTGGTNTFGIRASEGATNDAEDYYANVHNFEIRPIPSCGDVSNIAVSNVTATSADINWDSSTSAETAWEYVVQPAGTGVPAGSGTSVTTNSASVSSLTEQTAYEVYVRADCGSGSFGSWVGPVNFTTPCGAITPDYTTDFSTFLPNCWEEANDGDATTGPIGLGAGAWAQNGTDARMNLWNVGDSDWLISPNFDLSAGGLGLGLEVYGQDFGAAAGTFSGMGSDDEVEVLISTDNGATWSVIYTFDATTNPITATTTTTVINLSAYTGTSNIIGIRGFEGTIDDPEDYYFTLASFQINSNVLSTTEFDNPATFTYYPNPVKNTLVLNAQNNIENVTMYNMLGQEVLRATPNATNSTLDMSSLQTGTYFAKVTIQGITDTVRIIKQ